MSEEPQEQTGQMYNLEVERSKRKAVPPKPPELPKLPLPKEEVRITRPAPDRRRTYSILRRIFGVLSLAGLSGAITVQLQIPMLPTLVLLSVGVLGSIIAWIFSPTDWSGRDEERHK